MLGRFMVRLGSSLGQFGQFRSVWVGSWSIWVSLGRFSRVGSVHGRVSLGQFGSVHGQFGSV